MFRVGFGYDSHPLVEDRLLTLGGTIIPHNKGTLGHSDGDALIHAICDAIFGALALGDIGSHFPDNDQKYKDIDSKILLAETCNIMKSKGWKISNVDSTICLEKPKIAQYRNKMASTLASILGIGEGQISIKATTNEKMGFIGREEGVSAYVVVLLYQES